MLQETTSHHAKDKIRAQRRKARDGIGEVARRLRSVVQTVRTRLPSQAIDLAVRVGGKESGV